MKNYESGWGEWKDFGLGEIGGGVPLYKHISGISLSIFEVFTLSCWFLFDIFEKAQDAIFSILTIYKCLLSDLWLNNKALEDV